MQGQSQNEFPFMGRGDQSPEPPPHEDADMPHDAGSEVLPATPIVAAIAMRRRGAKRRDVTQQLREIIGLLDGQGRTSIPGTAPLVDLFERARKEQHATPAGWDSNDWREYLEMLETEDDVRWRDERNDAEHPPLA